MILLLLLTAGIGIVVLLGGAALGDWVWRDTHQPKPREDQPFVCWCCNSGLWERGWDPIEGGMTSRRRSREGYGLCPNCSGAD